MTKVDQTETPNNCSKLSGVGLKIGIVFSRFNNLITSQLLKGAEKTLIDAGVNKQDITIVDVPGALEIPYAAQSLVGSGNFDALITIGCVIRGETSHYEIVANQTVEGINRVSLDNRIPITFGVLTTENVEQAIARSGGDKGNLGIEAALAAIELAGLTKRLSPFN
ncbi:MAG: 6,7-dimethyl-8-ribityllumazine synthase [Chloroflexi bacterium]|nr:MAG: 6,7-dimethyl-8-ribityllumazine synthase [Chloroflexota bacterium]